MSDPAFRRHVPGVDDEALVAFLSSNHWPYHVSPRPSADDARKNVADGDYAEPGTFMFWIEVDGETVGFVRAMEIGDGDPQVDVRLAEAWRGRGLGRLAVRHLVGEVFAAYPDVDRIEGNARRDNAASRRTLRACGLVKEAVYRRAYAPYVPDLASIPPGPGGAHPTDAIGYAILRSDWETGTSTPVDFDEEP